MALDTKTMLIRSLSDEMVYFDAALDKTNEIRDRMIVKLDGFVEKIKNLDADTPELTATNLSVITTTLRALSDQEAAAARRVTAKLRHQESKRTDNASEQVVKLLQELSLNKMGIGPTIDLSDISVDLERAFRETGDSIDETELRADPSDMR